MEISAASGAQNRKVSRADAARQIAAVDEKHLAEQGLNEKVKQFATRVVKTRQINLGR